VGDSVEIHLDSGIMTGQDVVAAIAHGARFTLIGRAYLYGLMAGGRPGVDPRDRNSARSDRAHHAPPRCFHAQ
jgi:isopentenyl diphosphate isomerase/L-lactate dehydrogenase-like FMN-dependent dehydrogenase